MSKTKRYLSILLCLVLLCTTLIPMYAFAADDTLQILCDGVVVSGNDKTPMHIKETEQKQLSVLFNGSETLPGRHAGALVFTDAVSRACG